MKFKPDILLQNIDQFKIDCLNIIGFSTHGFNVQER